MIRLKTADETAAPVVFHVDVNSAFLSWEAVYRIRELGAKKDLRDGLCAVGGDRQARRGIILAKSQSAKGGGGENPGADFPGTGFYGQYRHFHQ